jgi:hypothetical protein
MSDAFSASGAVRGFHLQIENEPGWFNNREPQRDGRAHWLKDLWLVLCYRNEFAVVVPHLCGETG